MALNKGKKILITGAGGFVGANFAERFAELGYKVFVIKRSADSRRLAGLKRRIKIYYADLKDYSRVESLVLKIRPRIILHFATYGAYQRTQQDVDRTVDTNLIGTINLVNACRKIKFDCFINTGSSSEYGIKNGPMKETDLPEPENLYGVTKAAATMYCRHISKKYNLPIATLRLFSVYGYFEGKERLIPAIIRSCLENKRLKLSSANSVRDFIFIEDVIGAYLMAIKKIKKIRGEVLNVGTGRQTSIAQIVRSVKEISGSKVKPEYDQIRSAQTEPKTWVADMSKTKKLLNWRPEYNIKNGLKRDMDWFKKNSYFYEEKQ